MHKLGKADVNPVRQQTQYNCVTTSLAMALQALGVSEEECRIERVNKVVGAMPLQGAAWEPMLAAANHYGMRATLTLPSTVAQLKSWTDAGKPVVIAWNPEGREWSHASLVFDVTEDAEHGFLVHIADPNIPDPEETVRIVPKKEFYSKWYEKAPQGYMIRRPACVIEREITAEGRQVMASSKTLRDGYSKAAARYNPDRNQGLSREELQEGWAASRQMSPTYFDLATTKAKLERSRLLNPWGRIFDWWKVYGTPRQRELVAWAESLPEEGLPRNSGELMAYQRAYKNVKDIYDHPSGKGEELFKEVQLALDLPTPLTVPSPEADKQLSQSVKPSGDFGKALDRVTDYESKLQGSREQIEKELERQVRLAIEALPEDMRAWVASKGVQVFAGIHHNLGMPSEEIEGGSSDVPRNANVVVGYTITGGIRLGGKPNQGALWEREFIFGVSPFFEKSPKPRLLRTSSISRNVSKVLFNLTESAKGVVYPPGKTSPRYSVTKAQYGQAKTLPQTSSVVAEISEAFGKSVAAWVEWERKEADRKEAEIKAKEEEERKRKEESVRKEMEVQEALRQKELARAKAPSKKTVVDSALSEKFAILDKLISNGFPQAQAAAQAVKDAYTSGGKPSEDQLKALRNMMYRSKMREEADQFRVASFLSSASRVVRAYLDKQAEEHDCLQDYRGGGLSRAEYEDCVQRARAMERGYTRSPRPSSDPHLSKKLEILNRLIQNRPSDFLISVRDQLAYRGSLSPKQQEAVRKWLRDPNEVALFGGFPPAKAPTQSGPTAQEAQLGALGNLLVRNPNSFVSSIHQQVAQGKSLTDNQKSAIRRVFYQAGMRSDADLFR